nr:hypothetical protein [Tanacetum cinerariifolium]
FTMVAACASKAVVTPSVISCRMVASVIAGVANVDVLLGGYNKKNLRLREIDSGIME